MSLPDFQLRVAEDDNDRKLLADIERLGWHVIHIFEDDSGPAFSFSVGFYYTFQQPEVLIMGLPQKVAYDLLDTAVDQMKEGKTFRPFERVAGFAKGYDCAFAPIALDHYKEYLGYAIWFYRSLSKPFPAMQLIWPDKQGHFPWEAGYDQRFYKLQKALYEAPPTAE
jgi:hypothetical protein